MPKIRHTAIIATIGAIVVLTIAYYVTQHFKNTLPFKSVCKKTHEKYAENLCNNIGKRAHSVKIPTKNLGPIIEVTWIKKGGKISIAEREERFTVNEGYFYLIGSDHSDYIFLKPVQEVISN